MDIQFKILFSVTETSSGKVFLVEEKKENTSTKYYAYILNKDTEKQLISQIETIEKSKHSYLFRKLTKMHLHVSFTYHLFNYYEESQFLDRKIWEYGKKKISLVPNEIKLYLKQLLLALYELHSNNIPGRIFSVFNILVIEPSQKIVLMDFGFGPDIEQDQLDILAPPEYLEEIIYKKQKSNVFDLKFDSWLVGAFLFHLIKFRSINYVEVRQNDLVRYKYDQKAQFYDHIKKISNIRCQTSRYNQNLLSFVEALLACDPKKRLSFYEIYQHQYIQDLNLEEQLKYTQFYKNFEYIPDYQNNIFSTEGWNKVPNNLNPPQFITTINSQQNQSPKKIGESQQPIKKNSCPEYLSIIMRNPIFSNPNYNNYWMQIQLDCLRCYILESTIEKMPILSKYQQPFEQVFAYMIKKMHFLILRETNNYLKSDYYQNQEDQHWKNFKIQHQKDLLKSDQISFCLDELQKELRQDFQQHCEIHLKKDSKLPQIIKQSLIDDNVQSFNMIQDSYKFYLNGYSQALEMLLQFPNQQTILNTQQQDEIEYFKKLIIYCIDIQSSFKPQKFQQQFKGQVKESQQVQPKDLIKIDDLTKQNQIM